jgi:nucleoside-diphosphate-sugar epimerase
MDKSVVLAGATGNLGGRIARELLARGAKVTALVRPGVSPDKIAPLRKLGAALAEVDFTDVARMTQACAGATCIVSALAGLRDVVVEAQSVLLEGAVKAAVPRFIPSDYSIDFTRLPAGANRNLDLRREFHQRLAQTPIAVTSIFNGAFMDLLAGQAPFILFKWRRVLCWGSPDQRLDFTTVDDTAAFTAAAALDESTPRALHVAGDRLSARDLAAIAGEVTGCSFRVFRPGGLGLLAAIIKVARTLSPSPDALYPAWQGMQYMHNMFGGLASVERLDNDRYPGLRWTTARSFLASSPHAAHAKG